MKNLKKFADLNENVKITEVSNKCTRLTDGSDELDVWDQDGYVSLRQKNGDTGHRDNITGYLI